MDTQPPGRINGVMIIPTGIACRLGGDAAFNPGIKLISQCCNHLIVNPNAVNASDINEMPTNCLYVEGSIIDRFLEGRLSLQEVKTFNRILMVVNQPTLPANINAANAGIWGLGAKIDILELEVPLVMEASINSNGTASGIVKGWRELAEQVRFLSYDALAIHTPIDCDPEVADAYWKNGGVNPWGAVEAIASKLIASELNKPVAHAPIDFLDTPIYNGLIVKRSMSCEAISNTYLFCILKGLHRAPRIDMLMKPGSLHRSDIDFLLTPADCWGRPHAACLERKIPIIIVKENTTCFKDFKYPEAALSSSHVLFVENYLEAAGVVMSWNAGVDPSTILVQK